METGGAGLYPYIRPIAIKNQLSGNPNSLIPFEELWNVLSGYVITAAGAPYIFTYLNQNYFVLHRLSFYYATAGGSFQFSYGGIPLPAVIHKFACKFMNSLD